MSSFLIAAPVVAALLAIASGLLGMKLAGARGSRLLVPLSGALLAGVTIFGLIPELWTAIGWAATLGLVSFGFCALLVLDHLGVAVCPSCQHGVGSGKWLAAAIGIHAFVDGWAMVAAGNAPLIGAMLLHKIPEGLAAGALTRSVVLLAMAEGMTVAGGLFGYWSAPGEGMSYLLALAAGSFLFLGLHAMDPRDWAVRENNS